MLEFLPIGHLKLYVGLDQFCMKLHYRIVWENYRRCRALRYSKTCKCLATLLPDELNSDVARIANHVRACLAANKAARVFFRKIQQTRMTSCKYLVARFTVLLDSRDRKNWKLGPNFFPKKVPQCNSLQTRPSPTLTL